MTTNFSTNTSDRYIGVLNFLDLNTNPSRDRKSECEYIVADPAVRVSAISAYVQTTATSGTREFALYIYDPNDSGNAYFWLPLGTIGASASRAFLLSPFIEDSPTNTLNIQHVRIPDFLHGGRDTIFIRDDNAVDDDDALDVTFKLIKV